MTFEVIVAENLGRLTTRDVRQLPLGEVSVDVFVLATQGAPFVGQVKLGEIPGGRGVHRGLVCPGCSIAKYKLFWSGHASLTCASCGRLRSRRQRERTARDWKHFGGREEDLVLRALRPSRRTSAVPAPVATLAGALMEADHERWTTLRGRVAAALMTAVAGDVGVDDIEEPDNTNATEENEHEPS